MNTRTIAHNSFWYGIERTVELLCGLVTSIAIARVIGPEKLGYFVYVSWLTNVSRWLGGLGIHAAARKYMAEYLGSGQQGLARAVFFHSLRLQAIVSLATALAGLALVFLLGDPAYRLVSVLLVLSMFPSMLLAIPAQANNAAENMAANVPAALVWSVIYVVSVVLSLTMGWGVTGLAAGILMARTANFVALLVPVLARMRRLPEVAIPKWLARKMFVYSRQTVVLLLLNVVVWDRSELVFLKNFCSDIRQVTFYSVAFNMTERILVVPDVFAKATGASLMAQYGRDKSRLSFMVSTAARYLALAAVPLHFGLMALSGPLIALMYGAQYLHVIPVLSIAALLGLGKAFLLPAQHVLEASENQKFLVKWGLLSAAVNVSLDWLLIPRFGAIGAAIANGVSQLFSVSGIWAKATRLFRVRLSFNSLGRLALCGSAMAVAVRLLVVHLPPAVGLAAGVGVGAFVFLLGIRLTGSLDSSDRQRLLALQWQMPRPVRRWFEWGVGLLAPTVGSRSSAA